jgi:peptidoglycan/LPS O-acetylase OafA/YrhL
MEAVPTRNRELLDRLTKNPHIPALDAVRGISAWMVVVGHTTGFDMLGAFAVSVFFVLSGFLITWLLVRESDSSGRISLRNFYVRRVLRIFPAFYVFWVVCVLAAIARFGKIPWGEPLASFFYLGDYYGALYSRHVSHIMGITWSLGVEEKFYLLWPAAFALLHRNPRKLLKVTLGFMAAIWLYRIVAALTLSLPVDYLRYAFEARFDNILFGCALALGVKLLKVEPLLAIADRFKALPLLIGTGLVVLAVFSNDVTPTFNYVVEMEVVSALVAVMLLQLVFLGSLRGWRWLDFRVFRFFGRISYSVYLYHLVVIASVEFFLSDLRLRWAYPIMYIGTAAVAYASYRLIERPFLRLKDRFEVVSTVDGARGGIATASVKTATASDLAS